MSEAQQSTCHPRGPWQGPMEHLFPDDPHGQFKPQFCPSCHRNLCGSQTSGYLCNRRNNPLLPEDATLCVEKLPPPKKLIFIEAAMGNCAGRCRERLSDQMRRDHVLVCQDCVISFTPMVANLLRLVSGRQTARGRRVVRGNGTESECGNPDCAQVVPDEELYTFPDESEDDLALVCPKCWIAATLVLLGRSYWDRLLEVRPELNPLLATPDSSNSPAVPSTDSPPAVPGSSNPPAVSSTDSPPALPDSNNPPAVPSVDSPPAVRDSETPQSVPPSEASPATSDPETSQTTPDWEAMLNIPNFNLFLAMADLDFPTDAGDVEIAFDMAGLFNPLDMADLFNPIDLADSNNSLDMTGTNNAPETLALDDSLDTLDLNNSLDIPDPSNSLVVADMSTSLGRPPRVASPAATSGLNTSLAIPSSSNTVHMPDLDNAMADINSDRPLPMPISSNSLILNISWSLPGSDSDSSQPMADSRLSFDMSDPNSLMLAIAALVDIYRPPAGNTGTTETAAEIS